MGIVSTMKKVNETQSYALWQDEQLLQMPPVKLCILVRGLREAPFLKLMLNLNSNVAGGLSFRRI